jgi:diketogulonate reductase-like aldo/keto reductase
MSVPLLQLSDGHTIPQVGLGTWKIKDSAEHKAAFQAAIEAGYRHIDTAQAYDNEQFLGAEWQKSSLKREELFITTKIAVQNFGKHKAARSFAESLERLQTDYVDLLLLHFPVPVLRKKTWQALEEIQANGQAKSIGVSNFTIRHLQEMESYAKVMPVINQVELHVFLQQPELIKYCQSNNIVVEAYSPLARAHETNNETIKQIAAKHNKTYAQVMLRWLIEQVLVVIPKSVNPSRIQENIDIFNFQLDGSDMEALKQEDKNLRICWSPVHVP